jgi:hypothetical protein
MRFCFSIERNRAIFGKSGHQRRKPAAAFDQKLAKMKNFFFRLQHFENTQNHQRNPWKNLDSDRSRPGEEEGHVTGNLS